MSETPKYIKIYEGGDIKVMWDRRLCIHVGECGRADNELFESGRDPWCDPEQVAQSEVQRVCERCPTGALTFEDASGELAEQTPEENVFYIANHGPIYVRGDLEIDGAADDMDGTKTRAALCRCGASKNKPFCDNSHESSGFADRGAVGPQGPGCEAKGGKLVIKRAPNGPLLIQGNFSIVASSGQVAFTGTKAALCRCGASKNKPFCDGAHNRHPWEHKLANH